MGIVIGIGLVVLGIGLVIARSSQSNKLMQIKGTETSKISELNDLTAEVAKEMGAGSFNQIAEVKGRSGCDNPLTSELAHAECVYYSMQVTREYEETYWDTDSNGNRRQQTRRGSDSVAHNVRSVPFTVDDGTGKIKILPDGAQIVAEKVFSQFQPGEAHGGTLSFGGLSFSLGGINFGGGGTRTLGYRYEEEIIPTGRDLYILGEAVDSGGELAIQKPKDKKNKFIVSVKSEEELIRGTTTTITVLLITGLLAGAGGITVAILSLLGTIKL
jgi:hypothetical protein